jgi:hypothetical protein
VSASGEEGLSCGSSIFTSVRVDVATNLAAKDELRIEEVQRGYTERCESNSGNAWASLRLAGPLTLRADGAATIGPAGVYLEYEEVYYRGREYENVACSFSRRRLAGTNTATNGVQPLEVAFSGVLPLTRGSYGNDEFVVKDKHLCPKQVHMSLSLPRAFGVEEQVVAGR